MSEPTRLYEEPESELERSLLRAGRSYTASASSRSKALAALGIVGVTASSTTAASAVTKATIAKWVTATALIAGGVIPAVQYLRHRTGAPTAPSTAAASPPEAAPVVAARTPSVATDHAPPSAGGIDSGTEPAPSNTPPVARAETKASSGSALSAELSALDTARSALADGNASAALGDLEQYAHQFPHGKLSLEAEVLRIDALAKSGQTAAAKKRAQAFMRRHPDSVLASRVRAYAEQ